MPMISRMHLLGVMNFRVLIFLLLGVAVRAAEPIKIPESESPSKLFCLVVYTDKKAIDLMDSDAETDAAVYLMDVKNHKKIGPLEEVDSCGGVFGRPTENVEVKWSSDSRWLAVTYRCGRLMHNFVLYEIRGRRAIPVVLHGDAENPKSKVFDHLTTNANPGTTFSAWISNSCFGVIRYGLRVKEGEEDFDFSKLGLADFGGALESIYQLNKSDKWVLKDIRVPENW